ncbi:Putative Mg2+ and Co2+ transporter CorB [Chryseobacterium taklimakanense]|uniref:Putative Mg2+ and Co2+ transporter CorB n=1 Tax=Chryseobacterium taklimakanense TaxID=536441 RepID=A0A239XXI3_9FLAO|nr:hemolysin family protein [Chryseobacterium taklimakanense]SNV50783.1 Putative Mg2+ and Co2+ transporter CorB [Chryseobacterium taklimakanense]
MSEIALVSAKKFKLENLAKKGSANARKAIALAEKPNTFLSTVQIGITLIGILTGIYSGDKITEDVKVYVSRLEPLQQYSDSISVVLVLVVLTFSSIVLGELIPKRIGLIFPEKIAVMMAKPMTLLSTIAKPFIWLLTKTNNFVLGIFGINEKNDGLVTEEEIKAMLQQSVEGGDVKIIEQNIVERVFALGDRRVRELMTPRKDLIYFDITDGLQMIKEKSNIESHSIYPVVDKNLDNLIGYVSVKELFSKVTDYEEFQLKPFIREPLFVHENTAAYRVLEQFKTKRIHYAFVVDEYGSLEGLIAMDDLMDALIGDATEYGQRDMQISENTDGSLILDGQFSYYELLQKLELEDEYEPGDYSTVGGFLISQLQHFPKEREEVFWNDYVFTVLKTDKKRIEKVSVKPAADQT